MKRKISSAILLLSLFIGTFSAKAATFGSTMTAKSSDPDRGLVCVTHATTTYFLVTYSHRQPADPKESEYGAEVVSSYSSSGGGTAGEQRYYLYAKPNDGYIFDHWEISSNQPETSTSAQYTYTWKHTTQTPNYIPGTAVAYFRKASAIDIETNIPVGLVSLNPEAPKVGDQVTATSTLNKVKSGNYENKNLMNEFLYWEDENGEILSYDEVYTFTVPREMTLRAVYRTLGEVPQPGKYYRVRNAYNRVLSVEGSYKYKVTGATDVPTTLLRWALPLDHNYDDFHTGPKNNEWEASDLIDPICPESSPSTILYVSDGRVANGNLNSGVLECQGVDTRDLTSNTFTITPVADSFYGYYGMTASAVSGAGLKSLIRPEGGVVNISTFTPSSIECAFAIQPIDEEHVDYFWFGASPDEKMFFDGRWWTTMYTAFPYKCYEPDGVEVYYLKEAFDENGTAYVMAQELEGGYVPAYTAVLLRCKSPNSKENRLIPLDPDKLPMAIGLEDNLLKGVLQLYTDTDSEGNGLGRVEFDDSTMKVFGFNKDGEVGFYSTLDPDSEVLLTLPTNRCYLDTTSIPEPEEEGTTRDAFKLTTYDILTGIKFVPATQGNTDEVIFDGAPIYDLMGRRIHNPQPGTIYIVNGKKLVWR